MNNFKNKVLISFKISEDANAEINKVLGDIADIYLLENIEFVLYYLYQIKN